jgi:hypothetical protein
LNAKHFPIAVVLAAIAFYRNYSFAQATIAEVVPLKNFPNQALVPSAVAFFLVFSDPHYLFDYFEFVRKSNHLTFFYSLRQLTSWTNYCY